MACEIAFIDSAVREMERARNMPALESLRAANIQPHKPGRARSQRRVNVPAVGFERQELLKEHTARKGGRKTLRSIAEFLSPGVRRPDDRRNPLGIWSVRILGQSAAVPGGAPTPEGTGAVHEAADRQNALSQPAGHHPSAEQAKHVGDEENQQYCPQSYTRPAAGAPAGMAVVPSTQAKNQHQNDDDHQHCRSSFLLKLKPRPARRKLVSTPAARSITPLITDADSSLLCRPPAARSRARFVASDVVGLAG
jgi:hypothetical protein